MNTNDPTMGQAIFGEAKDEFGMKARDIEKLSLEAFEQASSVGFWDEFGNPLLIPTKLMLIVSEVSEAKRAFFDKSLDSHLVCRMGFEVELADVAIRCLDLLGHLKYQINPGSMAKARERIGDRWCRGELAFLPQYDFLADAMEAHRKSEYDECASIVLSLIILVFKISKHYKFNLREVIREKMDYNRQRLDHKRQNREVSGGKKY